MNKSLVLFFIEVDSGYQNAHIFNIKINIVR